MLLELRERIGWVFSSSVDLLRAGDVYERRSEGAARTLAIVEQQRAGLQTDQVRKGDVDTYRQTMAQNGAKAELYRRLAGMTGVHRFRRLFAQ